MNLLSRPTLSRLVLAGTLASAVALPVAAQDPTADPADSYLTAVPAGTYKSSPMHSYITFSYSHFGLSHPTLAFDDFEIILELDTADPTKSSVAVTIDTDSVVAGSEIWHEDLTGENWFDADNNPEITFSSTSIESAGDGAYAVNGDLMLHGETKPVTMNMTINAAMNHPMSGDPVVGIDGSGEVLRSDFGLGKFAPHVSDEVAIKMTAEMLLLE